MFLTPALSVIESLQPRTQSMLLLNLPDCIAFVAEKTESRAACECALHSVRTVCFRSPIGRLVSGCRCSTRGLCNKVEQSFLFLASVENRECCCLGVVSGVH